MLVVLGWALAGAMPVEAQVQVGLRMGAVGSTEIVRDSVVEPIEVRPQVAPQIGLAASFLWRDRLRIGATFAVSRSDLQAISDSATTSVTRLTLWAPGVFLRVGALPWLTAEARLGAVVYDPSETEGTLFSEGAPIEPYLGVGVAVERALGNRLAASLFAQYDAHRFTTAALDDRGFTGKTLVHRIALGLSLSREFGHATP